MTGSKRQETDKGSSMEWIARQVYSLGKRSDLSWLDANHSGINPTSPGSEETLPQLWVLDTGILNVYFSRTLARSDLQYPGLEWPPLPPDMPQASPNWPTAMLLPTSQTRCNNAPHTMNLLVSHWRRNVFLHPSQVILLVMHRIVQSDIVTVVISILTLCLTEHTAICNINKNICTKALKNYIHPYFIHPKAKLQCCLIIHLTIVQKNGRDTPQKIKIHIPVNTPDLIRIHSGLAQKQAWLFLHPTCFQTESVWLKPNTVSQNQIRSRLPARI